MKTTAAKPYANTRLIRFLEKRILELRPRKTQSRIAIEAGFSQVNMLANIKSGASKLPLDRVFGLANALETDPAALFAMALEQLRGDTTEAAVRKIFKTVITDNELEWLNELREASGHSDPGLTVKARASLRGIFGR